MFNVANYFKKFQKLEGDTRYAQQSVQGAFTDICGLNAVDFQIKKGIVYINGNSMLKSVVFMKKTALIERLSETNPLLRITDIR